MPSIQENHDHSHFPVDANQVKEMLGLGRNPEDRLQLAFAAGAAVAKSLVECDEMGPMWGVLYETGVGFPDDEPVEEFESYKEGFLLVFEALRRPQEVKA